MVSEMIFVSYILLLTICYTVISTNITLEPKIIGGRPCLEERAKFAIRILNHSIGSHYCGGSLVRLDMVLTAAHCLRRFYKNPESLAFIAGDFSGNEKGKQRRRGKYFHSRTNFESMDRRYDIGIAQLDHPFSQSNSIALVKLPNSRIELLEVMCPYGVLMGWGRQTILDPENRTQDYTEVKTLSCVTLQLLNNEDCEIYKHNEVADTVFCAWHRPGGKDSCKGDSGGPFMCKGMQIGIDSTGYGCGLPESPTSFIRVDRMLDFINSTLFPPQTKSSANIRNMKLDCYFVLLYFIYFIRKNV